MMQVRCSSAFPLPLPLDINFNKFNNLRTFNEIYFHDPKHEKPIANQHVSLLFSQASAFTRPKMAVGEHAFDTSSTLILFDALKFGDTQMTGRRHAQEMASRYLAKASTVKLALALLARFEQPTGPSNQPTVASFAPSA